MNNLTCIPYPPALSMGSPELMYALIAMSSILANSTWQKYTLRTSTLDQDILYIDRISMITIISQIMLQKRQQLLNH
jgi:hypothetical protein